jgi:hypothetical protein
VAARLPLTLLAAPSVDALLDIVPKCFDPRWPSLCENLPILVFVAPAAYLFGPLAHLEPLTPADGAALHSWSRLGLTALVLALLWRGAEMAVSRRREGR